MPDLRARVHTSHLAGVGMQERVHTHAPTRMHTRAQADQHFCLKSSACCWVSLVGPSEDQLLEVPLPPSLIQVVAILVFINHSCPVFIHGCSNRTPAWAAYNRQNCVYPGARGWRSRIKGRLVPVGAPACFTHSQLLAVSSRSRVGPGSSLGLFC